MPWALSWLTTDRILRVRRRFLIDEAAQLLGVSRRTVYYRIGEGRLQTIRTRCGSQRVLSSSIEALLGRTLAPLARAAGPAGRHGYRPRRCRLR